MISCASVPGTVAGGGGIWEQRAWFDACDEFGVMLYLDMQFTWGSIGVTGATSETVRQELVYQIERISHHPSVVILDGCNECGGGGLTESFVMPIVAATDPSRAVWPSCPASCWKSGVDRLTARPNGKTLVTGVGSGTQRPAWPSNAPVKMPMESHGGYVGLGGGGAGHLGEGRPGDVTGSFGVSMMSTITNPALTSPSNLNWYKSEFGEKRTCWIVCVCVRACARARARVCVPLCVCVCICRKVPFECRGADKYCPCRGQAALRTAPLSRCPISCRKISGLCHLTQRTTETGLSIS